MRRLKTNSKIMLLEFMATIMLFVLSFYVFAKGFTSTMILFVLTSISPFKWSIEMLFLSLIVFILVGFFYDTKSGWPLASIISWILLLPSILGYSSIDVLRFFGIPFNLGVFKPDVPIPFVLGIGVLLAAGDLFFFNMDSLQWIRLRLSSRGAPLEDIEVVIWNNFIYLSSIVIISVALTLGASISVLLIADISLEVASKFHLLFIIVPVAVSAIISITLLLYLRNTGELRQKEGFLGAAGGR
jgi:hypothetical protein